MNEQQWLSSVDPAAMLSYLTAVTGSVYGHGVERERKPSARKLRLWIEACRSQGKQDDRPWGNYDLETPSGLRGACDRWTRCNQSVMPIDPLPVRANLLREIVGNPYRSVQWPSVNYERFTTRIGTRNARCLICGYVACGEKIERNHRRFCFPYAIPLVVDLATGIYEERAFDRMPFLGDALEEAGCTDRAILDHCRGTKPVDDDPEPWEYRQRANTSVAVLETEMDARLRGPVPHVRGCWVTDLILGKS